MEIIKSASLGNFKCFQILNPNPNTNNKSQTNPNTYPRTKPQPITNHYPNNKPQPNPNPNFTNWEVATEVYALLNAKTKKIGTYK